MAGHRKYLEIAYSTEERALTTIDDEGNETSAGSQVRTVETERAEIVGLTKSEAESLTATSGWAITVRRSAGRSNLWTVEEQKITYGSWT